LAATVGRVGVISGRPISFLAGLLPDGVALSGLYGLETLVDGEREDHEQSGNWREVVADLGAHATAAGPDGMRVETKELSITLHYRERPELADDVQVWAAEEAARSGLQARPARRSWELHPPIDVDKGSAVVRLAGDASAVCFIGDDHGDLPAFAALEALAAQGRATLKVAVDSVEASAELLDRADLVVEGPEAVEALLEELDRLVHPG
ncbi:MAG: trehalose-phosphatase, partial [Actinomycetota bacterium]